MSAKLPIPVRPATRTYWSFAIVLSLFVAGAFAPFLLWPAVGVTAFLLLTIAFDVSILPRAADLDITRIAPDSFALGAAAALCYRVNNRSVRPVRLAIAEAPIALLRYECDPIDILLPAQSTAQAERPVVAVQRGTATLDTLYVTVQTRLGLVSRLIRVPAHTRVRVYPDLSTVARYGTLHARNRLIEAGLRRMRLRGAGTQVEGVRDWSPGDSFRAVNWKASARRGKMMVSQYEIERSQEIMIVLDAGRLMMPPVNDQRKFDYSLTAALSLAAIAGLADDKVGAIAFARDILTAFAPGRLATTPARIMEALHGIVPRFEESDYLRAFAYLRTHVTKRSLIVFFTDMIDPAAQSTVLAEMGTLCRRHLVLCVFMNDGAIDDALERQPRDPVDVYAAGVALGLRDERRLAAAALERLGIGVLDVPAAQLTTALIDRYLRIKQRGLL